jgi:hypothetical protein
MASFMSPATLPLGKQAPPHTHTLSKRTDGPQGSRGYFGEKKNLLPVRNQTMIPQSSSTQPWHCTNCACNFISALKRKVIWNRLYAVRISRRPVIWNRLYAVHISTGPVIWKMRINTNRRYEMATMRCT